MSVSPSSAWIWSNLFMYLRWSRSILQSEFFDKRSGKAERLMMLSFTMDDEIISSTSCVTTTASPKNLRTVLYM